MTTHDIVLRMLTVGDWQENCYSLVDPQTNESLLVDPGAEAERIQAWLAGTVVKQILITHAHPDHIGAAGELRKLYGVEIGVHPEDWELARQAGLEPDFELQEGDQFTLGGQQIRVVHTPGHTPGSVCLHAGSWALVGDAVFPGGPGHTNSPQALEQLLASLRRSVFTWPDETGLFPGHGPPTTSGRERAGFEALLARSKTAGLYGDVTW